MQGFGFSLAGLVVGLAVGATGVGGGSLMTPILILFYGISPSLAVGTDLLYASVSKSFGVLLHGRNGSLDWRIVGWLSAGSVPATLAALLFLHGVEKGPHLDAMIKLTLSIAIIVTATFALLQEQLLRLIKGDSLGALREWRDRGQIPLTIVSGALIGALVTISSVGAGVIGMMLLLLIYPRTSPISLVGSDLAHAVLITAIAGIGHISLGTVDYSMLGYLLIGALPGIWLGSKLAFRLSPKPLKRLIAGFLVFIGSSMLIKVLSAGA
ncbi:MAG: sulfite exporter TauE/SafE family protein [Nevskiaceae bacterium]|nr:MAG: sulfite exporter TauE/SafE family protein [Nevskiaceae bacterium]